MPKRVLLLIKGLGRGGAEQILASAAPHLDRARFDYEVAYLLPWKDALVKDLEDANVPTRCLNGSRGVAWVERLRRLVADERFDLVHAHSPVAAAAARVSLWGRPLPIVYTEHNVWERYHRATFWSNALTYPRNRHVFAVSDHVRDSIRYPVGLRHLAVPPLETLYHGIDRDSIVRWASHDGVREEFHIAPEVPVVGTVANFKSHKRLDQLLRAFALIRRSLPDARLVLVGQGPLEGELRSLSHELGLGESVVFTGFREDAPRVCSMFDVFALSSEHEGLSIALIEALALGIPAVVTDVGGLSEVIQDGRQGYIVPVGRPSAFGDRIVQLLQDPALRSQMGAEGRARALVFDIRNAVHRMEQVYQEDPGMTRVASRVDVRPYRDGDEEAVLGLLDAALGGGPAGTRPAEFFRWKHLENPFGRSFMLVAEARDRIVGLRAFMRWEFTTDDRRFHAVRAVDTATHPDHQGQGIFSRLTLDAIDALRDQADFIFNTPNEQSLPGYLKMGWSIVGRVPIRIRVRRPIRFATRARSWRSANELGDVPPLGAIPAAELLDERVDGLLASRERPPGIATARDRAYLRWRYAKAPLLDYRAIGTAAVGGVDGLAVFRVRPRGSLVEATLAEAIVQPGDRRAARTLLRGVGAAAPVDHVACSFPSGSSPDMAARRSGWLVAPGGMTLVVNPLGHDLDPSPLDLRSWALTVGDLEVF